MNLESWMSLELFHYSWKQWMHLTVSIDFHSIFFFLLGSQWGSSTV